MGSCFAQTMGQKMVEAKFDCLVNPFGTIYNPLSLIHLLDEKSFEERFDPKLILQRDDSFFHFQAHSEIWGNTKEDLLEQLQQKNNLTQDYLASASHLVLTFGTAWIYELSESGESVANCHKQTASTFQKRLLSLEEMEHSYSKLFRSFQERFPSLKIILTLSPVRHIKDGVSENQLSKSLLRVLCGKLENDFEAVSYFPAYEILVDELRDYRFYKSDLVHPSFEAENYIWEKWGVSHFEVKTQEKVEEIRKVQLDLAHRSFNPKSPAHQKFLANLLKKLERLDGDFDFSNELKEIKLRFNQLD